MLNILLMDCDADNTLLAQSLADLGHQCARLGYEQNFLNNIKDLKPDLLVFNLKTPAATLWADLQNLALQHPLPILMFAQDGHVETISKAINAEVGALVADGFAAQRLDSLIAIACARFRQLQQLKNALDEARAQLEERKLIDRAKAILIKTQNFSEDESYHTLRKLAMTRNITIGEMAKNVIAMAALLK